ncbi:hypothetical protein HPB48_026073 [Haemaphysalis longicornis]|uniref:Uncharacterized protein n=1 Tax=Haemaphysalis longicornis TaxID=44386 RepID=A0A9J6H8Q6_HAELO|nr:hypothetical protein HPB48_026073 [Haemaphysalis longicornis]
MPDWGKNAHFTILAPEIEAMTARFFAPAGDLGYYDKSGRVHLVERLKELIKTMDNQVVPGELEDLIRGEMPRGRRGWRGWPPGPGLGRGACGLRRPHRGRKGTGHRGRHQEGGLGWGLCNCAHVEC